MKYVGSKNRISKELSPIIQSYINKETNGYFEPFVGGGNMIDKIKCDKKIGMDNHEALIELLKYSQNLSNELPEHISEEEYIRVRDNKKDYPSWYVGLVGFCSTYSARYFEGYARSKKSDGTPRDMSNEAIRNLEKQRANLQNIEFSCMSFESIDASSYEGYVIYCDIPYDIKRYSPKKYYKSNFDYNKFYGWCSELSKHNTVLVSEYNMPKEFNEVAFEEIWSKKTKATNSSYKKSGDNMERVEKLFLCK